MLKSVSMSFVCMSISVVGFAQVSGPVSDVSTISAEWARLWTAKQLDSLIALYAPNASFLSGDAGCITGHDSIFALFKNVAGIYGSRINMQSVSSEESDSLAYDCGDYYETTYLLSDKIEHKHRGNYLDVFRRQRDGKWLIVKQVWTEIPDSAR